MPGEAGARAAGANVAIVALGHSSPKPPYFGGFRFLKVRQRTNSANRGDRTYPCRCNTSADSSAQQPALSTAATLGRKDFSAFSCSATKSTPALRAEP